MHLRYDEDLVEAVVLLCARGPRPEVPAMQVARFHHERERLYRIRDPEDRNAAFFRLHFEWFREWGLEARLTGRLKEFPLLRAALALLAFRQTRRGKDEGAELFVNEGAQRNAVVALRPERFTSDDGLAGWLRHELTHLSDMVDPAFGYAPELPARCSTTARDHVTRERYRLLWDVTIDGRLAAAGQPPRAERDEHWAAFTGGYGFWPAERQQQVFHSLWTGRSPHHATLVELASDPRGLGDAHRPAPGASCPLCGFPTFNWVEQPQLSPGIEARVSAEFPGWSPDQGLCQRCHEAYEVILLEPADAGERPALKQAAKSLPR
jgi:hypothetical protein